MHGVNGVGKFALVDDYNYEKAMALRWHVRPGGHTWYPYAGIKREDGTWTTISMHRYLFGDQYPGQRLDHIDRNGWNNTASNIRVATARQNGFNKAPFRGKTSRYRGVYYRPDLGKWGANIKSADGRLIHLGFYECEELAAYAYDTAARLYHGEFAYINFPDVNLSQEEIDKLRYKRDSTSRFVGVSFHKKAGKWSAYVDINKKRVHLGLFEDEAEAAKYRNEFIIKNNLSNKLNNI